MSEPIKTERNTQPFEKDLEMEKFVYEMAQTGRAEQEPAISISGGYRPLQTVNSVSGGKSSAYIMANYPADYNVFSLVRIERPAIIENRYNCLWMNGKDEPTRQLISDRIGKDFYGTAEEDTIIYTILDLEQYLGQEIKILSGKTFDEVIREDLRTLPDPLRRECTVKMKIETSFEWWYSQFESPAEFRIGFRKGEERRAVKTLTKCNADGFLQMEWITGQRTCKRKSTGELFTQNTWSDVPWQKPTFPLIENLITRDIVEDFWRDKPVRFARKNNCVNCFHQDPMLVKHRIDYDPTNLEVIKWAATKEHIKHKKDVWFKDKGGKLGLSMSQIMKFNPQYRFVDDDFNDCDSGYCGI